MKKTLYALLVFSVSLAGCAGLFKQRKDPRLEVIELVKRTPVMDGIAAGKGAKASTLDRSGSFIERFIDTAVFEGENLAYVPALFVVTANIVIMDPFTSAVMGSKPIELLAQGTYIVVKDPESQLWFIAGYPEYDLLFAQGDAPSTALLNAPYQATPGSSFTVEADVAPFNTGNSLFVAFRVNALGLTAYLMDDGVAPDAAANDGVFTGSTSVPSGAVPGDYVGTLDVVDKTLTEDLSLAPDGAFSVPYAGALLTTAVTVSP